MPYVTLARVATKIPPAFIIQALDDDNDGIEDPGLWDAIAIEADGAVDARLGRRYPVPFSAPLPALVSEAALTFACEILHQRRGQYGEKNPFTKQADALRKSLDAIGGGDGSLSPGTTESAPPISIITEPARTVPRHTLNG